MIRDKDGRLLAVAKIAQFTCLLKDESDKIYASKYLPQFLDYVLKDEQDDFYKKLHDDPRYIALIERIEAELAEKKE